jgi:hypothetical protein
MKTVNRALLIILISAQIGFDIGTVMELDAIQSDCKFFKEMFQEQEKLNSVVAKCFGTIADKLTGMTRDLR